MKKTYIAPETTINNVTLCTMIATSPGDTQLANPTDPTTQQIENSSDIGVKSRGGMESLW